MTHDGTVVSGDRELTRTELNDRALRAASGLSVLGVEPGDRVALLLRNDLAFLEASAACIAVRANAVAINWHLAAPEVAYILQDSGAGVLIAHADLLAGVREAVADGVSVLIAPTPPEVRDAYGLSEEACAIAESATPWHDWLARFAPLRGRHPKLTETMLYTSGTTGRPKGVWRLPRTPAEAEHFLTIRDRIYGLAPGVRCLVAGPLYHGAPNAFGMRAAGIAERIVLMPRFHAENLLALIERHRISNLFMVPTMFVRLLHLPKATRVRYDFSSLRYVVTAAAPCPPDVKQAMIDWWGPIVHEFYATTEMGYMTFCSAEDSIRKPGTVGRRLENVTLKALDAQGRDVPPGEPGQLYGWMHGSADFTYHGREDERRAIEIDGLVTGGDVGYFDADGYLFLCDRARDMVVSGGVNVYPAEIEAALIAMPEVADCAVFGVPDSELGETLMAVVQPRPSIRLDPEAIRSFLRQRLAGFKIPRTIAFQAELPRDDSGKIFKRRLRDPYWAKAGRRI